ncbi:MAG: NAD(P)/FAD-dependent oxidoreductase [Oligoflexia bacterium]|nr:NAD(P)/FAD-dependent oxidoreductase [Oligoflexia bacterium]
MNNTKSIVNRKHIVVIGGGLAGLKLIQRLLNSNYNITLIDSNNHHLFQPLLYQVATAALSPSEIAIPLRMILRDQDNVKVIMGTVTNIDKEKQIVSIQSGEIIKFDFLAVAIGSEQSYFGNNHWAEFAPGLKSLRDAVNIREKILTSYEKAELITDKNIREKYLNFVIVGGGPTGVEMAGAVAEIANKTLTKDFRRFHTDNSKIYLIQKIDRILYDYPEDLSFKAQLDLKNLGVEVLVNTSVVEINAEGVKTDKEFIPCTNIIWAAGNVVSPLLKCLNTPLDNIGRVIVKNDLSIEGHPNIFVLGDAAHFIDIKNDKNTPSLAALPSTATVAIQQGDYLGKLLKLIDSNSDSNSNLSADLNSQSHPYVRMSFKYWDKGKIATIGRSKAVAYISGIKLTGMPAWLLWVVVHVWFLISFHNKIIVIIEWIWAYFTYERTSRIILSSNNKTVS